MFTFYVFVALFSISHCHDHISANRVHPLDCTKYYTCAGNKEFEKIETCATKDDKPTYFDASSKECVTTLPMNQNCIENTTYTPKGVVEMEGDMPMYRVGSGSRAIIWNYAIQGFANMRQRQISDMISDLGYQVIIPDYYRGDRWSSHSWDPVKFAKFMNKHTNWTNLKEDVDKRILPYARRHNATKFFTVGTCWGSYMTIRLSSYPEFLGGVSLHPSHSGMMASLRENETAIMEAVRSPQLFLVASTDHNNTKPNGLDQRVLGDLMKGIEVYPPGVPHGWTIGGNLNEPLVLSSTKKAIGAMYTFLASLDDNEAGAPRKCETSNGCLVYANFFLILFAFLFMYLE